MALRQRTRLARRLRRNATEVEGRLWWALRRAFPDVRFRRQHPIGRYVSDFACPSHNLVIELDGSQHLAKTEADAERTAELAGHGYRVIRFWNGDVIRNLSGVLEAIRQEILLGRPPTD